MREWFFEVWNEPNLKAFWTGTQQEYFKLYKVTAKAIKGIDALLQVGGPATANNAWIPELLDFCQQHRLPIDFVSTHHYPTDAFGEIGANTTTQLQHAPPSILRDDARHVRDQSRGLPVYYTEWNISSNPRDPFHDEPFAAAYVTNIIMQATGLVRGYSFWTFSDIFNENYFPSVPFHGGFGLLNIHGIAKPTYRAFQILHALGTDLLAVEGSCGTVDAWAVRKAHAVAILLTNHAMPRHSIHTQEVGVRVTSAQKPRLCYVERIDDDHANPRRRWESMGKPTYLSAKQLDDLQHASLVRKDPQSWRYSHQSVDFKITLPPHSVAAVTMEFA